MTHRRDPNDHRPTIQVPEIHADHADAERPCAEQGHDSEGMGVQVITTVLLGLTVLGAVAMLGVNWTMG